MSSNVRPEGWFPIIVVYRRPWDCTDSVIQAFGGGSVQCEFTHCELYVPDSGETFTIFAGGTMTKDAKLPLLYNLRSDRFAWHIIPLKFDEYTRLIQWNKQQIAQHCPYNFRDLAWQIVPENIRNSFVKDLAVSTAHTPRRIFCSQAIILALREASNGVGARQILRDFVFSANSRLVTPTDLSRMVTQYLGVGVNCSRVPTTSDEINKHLLHAVYNPTSAFSVHNLHATLATRQFRQQEDHIPKSPLVVRTHSSVGLYWVQL